VSTLGAIRGNVRANLGEATPNFYLNTDLNRYIGEAYKKYSMLMLQEGDGYFQEQVTLPLVAGDPTVDVSALTPPFFSIARLERNTSTGTYPLKASERRFTPNSLILTGVGDSYRPTYRMRGLRIILEPTPQGSEAATSTTGLTLGYNYVPTFPTATSPDGFTFDTQYPVFFEPVIELYATIAAMESKDGMGGVSDIQSFRDRLAAQEKVFLDSLERTEYPDSVQYIGIDYANPNRWY